MTAGLARLSWLFQPAPSACLMTNETPETEPAGWWPAALFVAALALLLASSPARDPSLWGHLAAGRALVDGAALPEALAGTPVTKAWAFNAAAYALFNTAGGAALVLAKAALFAGLGLLVLVAARSRGGWWAPVAATSLTLLACAIRLPAAPTAVSYFLFGLALWLLSLRSGPPAWALPLVFVAWANTDPWFTVGLAALALHWLGRAADGAAEGDPPAFRFSWLVLAAAACLLNPDHVRAFALPPELAWLTAGAEPGRITSPFSSAYLNDLGATPAGLAYFALLLFGLVSFAANRSGWRWGRFLPWLGLAVLAGVEARATPYFALVGGPVLAWNLTEALARRGVRTVGPAWRLTGAAVGLGLLASAWPGWLLSPPYEPRRWAFEPPATLQRGAVAVRTWGGLPAGARVLHLTPETAFAFAWHLPAVWGTLDAKRGGITHVVGSGRSRLGEAAVPSRLIFLAGGVAVFGDGTPIRLESLVFADGEPVPDSATADGRPWWHAFFKPAPALSASRDEASLCADLAEAAGRDAAPGQLAAWEGAQIAGLVGAYATWTHADASANLLLRLVLYRPPPPAALPRSRFLRRLDDIPPPLLYRGIRAARRAAVEAPDDAVAHLLLGEAYLRLLHSTAERVWAERLPELGQLRSAQASAALNRALALNPGLARAHLALGALYRDLGYLDLALSHLRAYTTAVRKAGGPDGEADLAPLARAVASARDAHGKEALGKRLLVRAQLAREKGLAGLALELLLGSDYANFGDEGLALELELLLGTGRPKEVRDWTGPQHRDALKASYHWLRAQALAAQGDYTGALDECARLSASLGLKGGLSPTDLRAGVAGLVGKSVLDGAPGWGQGRHLGTAYGRAEALTNLPALGQVMRKKADVSVLSALLLLEVGHIGDAGGVFRETLALWRGGMDFAGRPAAEAWAARLREVKAAPR